MNHDESLPKLFAFPISNNHHDEHNVKHPLKRKHRSGYTQDEYYLPSLIYDVWQTFYHNKQIYWILWPCFIKHDVDMGNCSHFWVRFWGFKKVEIWIFEPYFRTSISGPDKKWQQLSIIITCPGLDVIIPCHFKVLRQLIPFFSDFGTFDEKNAGRINGVDEPADDYNQHYVATSPQIHAHNPFRPPTHVMFTELTAEEDGQALVDILTLCYTNQLKITESNVVSLYKVANLLHMKDLCKSCVNEMSKEITLDNAVKYWNAADGNESVCSSVVDDLADITEISKNLCSTQFAKLTTDQIITLNLEQLKYLLLKDDLGVDHEDQVFSLVLKWLEINAHVMKNNDGNNTIHNMALELIPLVRLPQCSFGKLVQLEKFAQKIEFNMDYENDRKLMKLALLAQRIRIALQEKENNEKKERILNSEAGSSIDPTNYEKHNNKIFKKTNLNGVKVGKHGSAFQVDMNTPYRAEVE